jgi:DNA polymerase-3 subunit delta
LILKAAQLESFLNKPDSTIRAALIYGPDYGLVQERSKALAAAAGDPTDPFAFIVFKPETLQSDPARLADEAAALTFSGRRRVIRVREAGDALTRVFGSWLDEGPGDAFVIVEAGDLGKRSTLRAAFEKSRRAVAIPCYPDSGAVKRRFIEETLSAAGLSAEPDALVFIEESLGADHGVTRSELDKLITYMSEAGGEAGASRAGRVRLPDVQACIGESTATSLDAVCEAVCLGDLAGLDRIFQRLVSEGGQAPVSVLRALARHLQRLWLAAGLTAAGQTSDQVMAQLKPPVFQRNRESFRRQMALWPAERVGPAIVILTEAELDCKTTGMPDQALCERALMRIAHAAAGSAPGGFRQRTP